MKLLILGLVIFVMGCVSSTPCHLEEEYIIYCAYKCVEIYGPSRSAETCAAACRERLCELLKDK